MNMFEYMMPQFKITKPIRLIELFAGVGSQAMALRDLGIEFQHYKVIEFDKYTIKSYNAIHDTDFVPLDIRDIHADDLDVHNKDQYEYVMTYSFPCQDLSKAGKQAGMSKNSGTRSGLLWEVERILKELNDTDSLPQVLLMENVPDVIGTKNIKDFNEWYAFLENLGYQSYYKILNAKNYGIPQNRNRCFMVSLLGNYSYTFPKPIPLKKRLKDALELVVDERYYLSDNYVKKLLERNERQKTKGNGHLFNPNQGRIYDTGGLSPTLTTMDGGNRQPMIIPENTSKGYAEAYPGDGVYIDRPHQKRGTVQKGMIQTLKTSCNDVGTIDDNLRIRKLTPLECWRLMGFSDEDYGKAKAVNSNTQLYKQAGNSIVKQVLMAIFKQMI